MQQDFAPAEVINRGFGGSTIREVIYYSDRILYKYNPKIVVLYVANDVWGRPEDPSIESLLDYFKYFEQSLHQRMPNTILNIVSMRPSPVKRDLIEKQNLINDSLKDYSSKRENTNFIDIRLPMYTGEGKLRNDIFSSDSLHHNTTGNQLLVEIVKPVILNQLK